MIEITKYVISFWKKTFFFYLSFVHVHLFSLNFYSFFFFVILCIYTRSSRDVMRNWFVQVTNNSRRNGNASYILGILSIWHNDDDDDTTTTNAMQSNSAGRREWGKKVTSVPTTTLTHSHTYSCPTPSYSASLECLRSNCFIKNNNNNNKRNNNNGD